MEQHVPTGTIVVGVDGSRSSDLAIAWAIEQAIGERRALTLVHAIEPPTAVYLDGPTLEADAAEMLAAARAEVARRAPDLTVHEVVQLADPRNLLLSLARDAGLLVVGSHGRGPVLSLLLGSVGVAVTRHAPCPVVVVRPGNPGVVRQGVLVGIDGSVRSLTTLDFAFRQASLRQLPLTVLHCFWDAEAVVAGGHVVGGVESLQEQARLAVAETVAGMGEKYPDVRFRTELARGLVDEALVRAAERMNLVVVGAHHGGTASRIIFGSVAAALVEHAQCPVAVVPSP